MFKTHKITSDWSQCGPKPLILRHFFQKLCIILCISEEFWNILIFLDIIFLAS